MSQIPGWRVCPVFGTYALLYPMPIGPKVLCGQESIIQKTVNQWGINVIQPMRNQCYSANEMMKSTSEPFNCVSVQANAYLNWTSYELISIKLKGKATVKEEVKRSNLTTILYCPLFPFLNTDFPSDLGQIKPSFYMTHKRVEDNIMLSGNNLPWNTQPSTQQFPEYAYNLDPLVLW